jgi:hypothetical protein
MRFLVDAQLPPALARFLESAGHRAEHVADLRLTDAPHNVIWRRAAVVFLAFLASPPAFALSPALETGPCALETAAPATVALVDDDLDLLLDDGRRAVLTGLEFAPPERAAARKRLSDWLSGKMVFVLELGGAGTDRWGRIPAAVFSPQIDSSDSSVVSVGAALLEEGLARFRPDRPAAPCASADLAAEAVAREKKTGLWARSENAPLALGMDSEPGRKNAPIREQKGMMLAEGVIRSVGETKSAVYLNFGSRRGSDFAAAILKRDLGSFEQARIFPKALAGRRARVRGLIDTANGARMEISSPAQIELLDGANAQQ